MNYQLPPLNGLRAFEAAARHLSFKRASRELFVTPGAISQQIKVLEDYFETPLFLRLSRSIKLTDAGRNLLPVLQEAFQGISDITQSLMTRESSGPLTISVLPSFAAKWLVPRLGRFRENHPEIDVRISASHHLVDFSREDVDLAIRHGLGKYPGLRSDRLMGEDVFPVCSPRLLDLPEPLKKPTDLANHTLLHDESPKDWQLWLDLNGVKEVDATRGITFNDAGMMVQAAVEGQGVALGRRSLMGADLKAGLLVTPFQINLPYDFAYYIVCPEAFADRPKIVAFREWLHSEVRNEDG